MRDNKFIHPEEFQKGHILKGIENHQNRGHYIIFIKLKNDDFIGSMITRTKYREENIAMSENHFRTNYDNGDPCQIIYNNTHLVPAKLQKFMDMGPFVLCGHLTELGIKFVKDNLKNKKTETWNQYCTRTEKRTLS